MSLCYIHRCTSPSSESTHDAFTLLQGTVAQLFILVSTRLSALLLSPACIRVVQDAHIPFDGQGQVLGGQKPMGRAGLRDAMAKAAQRRAQVGVHRSRE